MQRARDELSEIVGVERWSEHEARVVVEAWRRSGMSLSGFAREQGISVERLGWWSRRLAETKESKRARSVKESERLADHGPLQLVPAVLIGTDTQREAMVVVRLPDGIEIELRDAKHASVVEVARLVAELRRSAS